MSVIATQVQYILENIFPANPHKRVFSEYYVNFKGTRLFFDFFIKELGCFIECQGGQHYKFVKHFHGDGESFRSQKFRDNLKIEYVQFTSNYLVRIYDYEKVTSEVILSKIRKAFDSEYNFCD